jgi:hypothetical protein
MTAVQRIVADARERFEIGRIAHHAVPDLVSTLSTSTLPLRHCPQGQNQWPLAPPPPVVNYERWRRLDVPMNIFETLINPDHEENPERAEIARAANLLQVGEFQFLQLAYYDWFGKEVPEGETDRLFTAYMLHDQVPHWARNHARRILELDEDGGLDENNPEYHRFDAEYRTRLPDGARKFCGAVLVITICIGGSIWTGHDASEPTSQILPPYFSDREIEQMGAGAGTGSGTGAGPNPTP